MKIIITTITIAIAQIILINHVNAREKPISTIINKNQAAELITKPANINSEWSTLQPINTNLTIKIDHSEYKKMNMMDYINNPELFLQSQDNQDEKNNYQRHNYEPVEYLKVPKLDSGITIKVGDF